MILLEVLKALGYSKKCLTYSAVLMRFPANYFEKTYSRNKDISFRDITQRYRSSSVFKRSISESYSTR